MASSTSAGLVNCATETFPRTLGRCRVFCRSVVRIGGAVRKHPGLLTVLVLLATAMNVTADPIVYQPYNINDSYIDYRLTTTSYGGLAVLLGGHADHTNSFRLHVLVQFPDLSSLPGNVQSATFELYRYGGGGTGAIISAYQITADWSESTVTPNNQPSVNPTVVGTFDAPDNQGVWHSFDITDLYNAWKAGTADNYGIELRTGNNNGEGYAYYSSEAAASYAEYRPRLVLTIPEPATVGVMALGALVVLRRRPGRHGA